jgi:hypothetical protein
LELYKIFILAGSLDLALGPLSNVRNRFGVVFGQRLILGWFEAGIYLMLKLVWNWDYAAISSRPSHTSTHAMLVLPQDQRFYACEIFAHMQKINRKHPTTIFLDFLKKIIK